MKPVSGWGRGLDQAVYRLYGLGSVAVTIIEDQFAAAQGHILYLTHGQKNPAGLQGWLNADNDTDYSQDCGGGKQDFAQAGILAQSCLPAETLLPALCPG